MRIKVINLRRNKAVDLRENRGKNVIKIDRTSIFGNPFRITKVYTREQSLKDFREYFYKRIATDKVFRRRIKKLKGHILACWCKPLPCHGDIIKEYLESES